jgi:hypothetical protein
LQAISNFIFIAEDVAFNEEKHQFVQIGFPAFSEPIGRAVRTSPGIASLVFHFFVKNKFYF